MIFSCKGGSIPTWDESILQAMSVYPNPKTLLHIYDHTILPVLSYGSEIWGVFNPSTTKFKKKSISVGEAYEGNHVDKSHVKFCKYILQVHRMSCNNAVLGELGRYPLYINTIKSVLSFWHRVEHMDHWQLAHKALLESRKIHKEGKVSWFSSVKYILSQTYQRNDLVDKPCSISKQTLINNVSESLKRKHNMNWHSAIFKDDPTGSGNKLRTYKLFKSNFSLEKYIILVKNSSHRKSLTRLRISAHDLEIERGRYKGKTPAERLCNQCSTNEIEDEIHFMTSCEKYSKHREIFYEKINKECKNFQNLNNTNKFIWLLSNEDSKVCNLVAEYVHDCFSLRVM